MCAPDLRLTRTSSFLVFLFCSARSALPDSQISSLLQEDVQSKGKRERFRVQQEALQKLKRMLSLHEARASAEESNTGERIRGLGNICGGRRVH